jgi:anti-sigma factor RsiW
VSHLGDRLAALVDGELDHESRDRALAHIATCDSCRAEVDAERRLKARIRSLSQPELAPDLNLRLLSLAGTSLGDSLPPGSMYLNPHLRRDRTRKAAAAAACILAMTLTTAFAVGGSPTGTPVRPAVDQYAVEHALVVNDVPLSDAYAGSDVVSTVYPALTAATQPETMQLLPLDTRPAELDVQPVSAGLPEAFASPSTGTSAGSASSAR